MPPDRPAAARPELAAAAQLAAANDTVAALRGQLTRTETAVDRERAEHHTVRLLHDLITSRLAAPPGGDGKPPAGRQRYQPPPGAGIRKAL